MQIKLALNKANKFLHLFINNILKVKAIRLILAYLTPLSVYIYLARFCLYDIGNKEGNKTILCIGRNLFDKDSEILAYRIRSYRWVYLYPNFLASKMAVYLPKAYRNQTIYQNTLHDRKRWKKCERLTALFLDAYVKKLNIVGILTANIDYYQDHALKVSCKEKNIPVFVLSKENPSTQSSCERYLNRYKDYTFNGTAIACFSKTLTSVFKKAGVADSSRIYHTGAPRLDRYRSIDWLEQKQENKVVILSFMSGYGLEKDEYLACLETINDVLSTRFNNKDWLVFLKTKSADDTKRHTALGVNNIFSAPNIKTKITSTVPLFDVFIGASLIIGYRSLSIVEAMLTNTRIVMPDYLLSSNRRSRQFTSFNLIGNNAGICFAKSKNDFHNEIVKALSGTAAFEKTDRLKVVNEVMGFDPEVSSSLRVARMIEDWV